MTRDPGQLPHLEATGASPAVADVLDSDAIAAVVRAAGPDTVMHQLTDLRDGSRAANAHLRTVGTRNLVDAARAAGVRRIVAQSIAWAYTAGEAPAAEDTPAAAPTCPGGCRAGGRRPGAARVGRAALRPALRPRHLVRPRRADGRAGPAPAS